MSSRQLYSTAIHGTSKYRRARWNTTSHYGRRYARLAPFPTLPPPIVAFDTIALDNVPFPLAVRAVRGERGWTPGY
jgi:hypothetical protein